MLWVMFHLENHICVDDMVGVFVVFLTSSIFWREHMHGSLHVYYRMLVDVLPYFLRRYFHMLYHCCLCLLHLSEFLFVVQYWLLGS